MVTSSLQSFEALGTRAVTHWHDPSLSADIVGCHCRSSFRRYFVSRHVGPCVRGADIVGL